MSLTNFTVYDASGTIIRSGACPEDQAEAQATAPGEYVIFKKTDIQTERVDVEDPDYHAPVAKAANSMVASKTTFSPDGVDVVKITNVPTNAKVSIIVADDMGLTSVLNQPVTDGIVEITTTQAGDYAITIDNGVLLPFTVTIHAI